LVVGIFTCLLVVIGFTVSPAWAIDWDFKGSLGEGEHKHYVPPVSNPILNETPFITTEARLFYMNQSISEDVPLPGLGALGGGSINLWALQLRVALTDRLGFIANKDGWADVNFNVSPVLPLDDDGFANLAFGFKYALISDVKEETLVTAGLTYEAPTGRLKAGPFWLQGNGDGFLSPFLSAAKSVDKLGLQGMVGAKFALDGDANTSWFNYSLHMDYEVLPNFYPLVEFNGFVPINDATATPFAFEGLDLVSIGGSEPSSVVTFAVGSRYKIMDHLIAGFAYEIPLTDDEDILDWRLTADLVIYY
jgi:hypothetical protein